MKSPPTIWWWRLIVFAESVRRRRYAFWPWGISLVNLFLLFSVSLTKFKSAAEILWRTLELELLHRFVSCLVTCISAWLPCENQTLTQRCFSAGWSSRVFCVAIAKCRLIEPTLDHCRTNIAYTTAIIAEFMRTQQKTRSSHNCIKCLRSHVIVYI